jgi:general secretion pathway protein A
MYERFYGFSEGPFELGPDPRSLYLTPSHAEALSDMVSGVRERKGITVITGDPGTGKTTLINTLLSDLDETVRAASIFFTYLEFGDLLKSILIELGIPTKGGDTSALLKRFYLYLSERPQDEIVAIIIDEAQVLETSSLKDLMGLWAGLNPRHQLLQTVLVGRPELEAKLDSQELREFRDRIGVRCHIRPMNRKESKAYIDHRLRVVGSSSSKVFKPEAVDRVCDYAGGIPRVINMICDGSLLIGHAKSKRQIDVKIVKKAIEELRLFKPKEAKRTLLERLRSLKPALHSADGREEPVPVLTTEPVLESLTGESVPEPLTIESPLEPLPAEESGRGEPAPEPAPVPRPRWQPVHQTLTGALLVVMVLGLFILLILDLVPPKETKVKGIGTVIAEKDSTFSLRAEQNQGLVPVPSASVKRERPQRLAAHKQRKPPQPLAHDEGEPPQPLAYKQGEPPQPLAHDEGEPPPPLAPYRPNDAERADLLLKQDPAWRALQR